MDNRDALLVSGGFSPLKIMELHVKNLMLSFGIASALLIAACGKKEEPAAPAAPAAEAPAPTATPPASTTTPPAGEQAPATTEQQPEQPKQ